MKKTNVKAVLPADFSTQKRSVILLMIAFFLLFTTSRAQLIIGWDANSNGNGAWGITPWSPVTIDPNLTGSGLIRGASIATSGGAAGSCWGGSGGWGTTDPTAVYFTFTVNAGYQASLSSISCALRRSTSGPASGALEYSLNNGTYVSVGNWATAVTSGVIGAPNSFALSGIPALQGIAAGSTIKFRFTYGGSSGTWYVTGGTNSLRLNGTVTSSTPVSTFSTTIAQTASIQCNGQSTAELTASVVTGTNSPFTYSWVPSGGTASVATGLAAGAYSCYVTSATSETTVSTFTVTQPAVLSSSISAQKNVNCNGGATGSATIAATGGTSPYIYTWSPVGGNSTIATALIAGIYTVNIADSKSCTASRTVSITEPAVLTSTLAQNNATCNGGSNASATVSPVGGTPAYSYTWLPSGGSASVASNLVAGNYTVNISDTKSCTTSQTIAITQPSTLIPIMASASNSVVCSGSTITLTGSGATTYTWSNGVTDGAAFTPTVTTTYSVIGVDANGCNASGMISVTVNITPTITVNSGVICPGGVFVLTPGGANTYTYSSGSATVMPVTSSTYSVNGTSAEGCPALAAAVSTVDISATLNVSISGPTVICVGDVANLTANGAGTYTWNTGELTYTIAPTPTVTTNYSVTGSSGSCSNTAVTTVSVNTLPVVAISGSSVICAGQAATLIASGASTYTWNTGSNATSITPTPTANINYTVVATGTNACQNKAVRSITVNATPTVVVQSGTICSGASFTFNPSGAATYTFSGGASVSPTVTTSYSVTGTNTLGCNSPTPVVVTVTVRSLPVITVNNGTVCAGKIFTMNPSGALTYTYSNTSNTVIPMANTSYSVTGTNSLGCVSATPAIASVTVNALPVISVSSGSICAGKIFTMVPSGASTYTYSNGSSMAAPAADASYSVTGTSSLGCISATPAVANVTVNAVPVLTVNSGTICSGTVFTIVPTGAFTYTYSSNSNTVSPTTTASYSVSGTSSLGCISSGSVVSTVTVISLPLVTVNSGTVCAGNSFTITPSGASTYTFLNGAFVVNPLTNSSYPVTGTSSVGCVSQTAAVSNVTVIALPLTTITSNTAVCNDNTLSLVASGATTYTWNTTSNAATLVITPTVNTSYTVTGKNANGCTNSATVAITVNPIPTINVPNGSMCPGASFTLNATGADTYTYSSGQVVSPATTTSYSVTGTTSLGCVSASAAVAVVTVTNSIVVSVAGTTLICEGQPAVLTAGGAATYTWNTGAVNATFTPSPSTTIAYTVTGSSGTCSNTAVISVSVLPTPTITVVSTNSAVCNGQSLTLTANGATTYTWTNGILNGTAFSPTATATYTVSGTDANGCSNTHAELITVNANPNVTIATTEATICAGRSATLNASGALTYSWNTNETTTVIAVSPSVTTGYTVTGTDVNGCKTTTVISQEVSPCTGIASATKNNDQQLIVFPNPNTGSFTIRSDFDTKLVLVNELGQLILTIDHNTSETEVKGLNAGIYFLSGVHTNAKIIVTH